jgi:elongation factor Ts
MESTEVSFTAKDVMALRRKTGLGMMDCKKALTECNGDMAAAEEWLRQQLKGKMDARTERPAAEGRIAIAVEGDQAAIIELRAETDFTARNEKFLAMAGELAGMALAKPAGAVDTDDAMTARIDDVRISTGENISFARGEKIEGGGFGSYIHHDGKRAALVQIEGVADEELLRGICQHIVAHVPPPLGVTEQDVPADAMDKVRRDAQQEAAETGKPPPRRGAGSRRHRQASRDRPEDRRGQGPQVPPAEHAAQPDVREGPRRQDPGQKGVAAGRHHQAFRPLHRRDLLGKYATLL